MNCGKTARCWLVAVDDSHDDIELPDGMSVCIGRSASTNISDTQVSRLHGVTTMSFVAGLIICADCGMACL